MNALNTIINSVLYNIVNAKMMFDGNMHTLYYYYNNNNNNNTNININISKCVSKWLRMNKTAVRVFNKSAVLLLLIAIILPKC